MANPYSDLTGNYIGANYNRAQDPNTQFGTRRLKWVYVEVGGWDIENEPGWSVEQGTAGQGPDDGYRMLWVDETDFAEEDLESPYSILYPILRAVAIKAEIYAHGVPQTYWDGEFPYTVMMVAVSQDTLVSSDADVFNDWGNLDNSWSLENTIYDALADNFNIDYVNAYEVMMLGNEWYGGPDALKPAAKVKKVQTGPVAEARAARKAANKLGFTKKK